VEKYGVDDAKSRELDVAVLKLIAADCLPISICESEALRELLEKAHPRYVPKDHKFMTRLLEFEYETRFSALKVSQEHAKVINYNSIDLDHSSRPAISLLLYRHVEQTKSTPSSA